MLSWSATRWPNIFVLSTSRMEPTFTHICDLKRRTKRENNENWDLKLAQQRFNCFPLLFSYILLDPWHPSGVMARASTRLASLCLNRTAVLTRAITRSPRSESKTLSAMLEKDSSTGGKQTTVLGRRIMVLVDSKPEAKGALQWALSHAVQGHDTVVLLDVVKPKHGNRSQNGLNPRRYELLYAMKNMCQARRPEVKVEVSLVEGKERGPTIVEEARRQEVSLLVLGQRKRSATWRLVMMWARNRVKGGVVDYCVQNASCMALAVRRKSRRAGGGYLITNRRHKNFWLLA